MALPPKIYSGSVKEIFGDTNKSPYYFSFTNKYSIYDWGEMPDHISNKGKALTVLADIFFRFLEKPENWKSWKIPDRFSAESSLLQTNCFKQLQEWGVMHHSLGLRDKDLNMAKGIGPYLAVQPIKVPNIDLVDNNYDYGFYQKKPVNALVPLEVIFRFGCPEGSSLLKRAQDKDYLKDLGISGELKYGQHFEHIVVEFSTKLEPMDRYLSYKEAQQIAGLTPVEFQNLITTTKLLSLRLYSLFDIAGVELWDGKFEFAFQTGGINRNFMLVDSIGPDELRLMYKDLHLSKEILRQAYQNSDWLKNMKLAKDVSKKNPEVSWKTYLIEQLGSKPEPLNAVFLQFAEKIYPSIVNELQKLAYEEAIFKNVEGIQELYENFLEVKNNV